MFLPKPDRLIVGQRGFSLIEVLVVTAILGTLALMVVQFNTTFTAREVSVGRICESHAHSLIAMVQEEAYYREVMNFIPVANTIATRSASSFFVTPSRVVPNAAFWWQAPVAGGHYQISALGTALNGTTLHNFQLIQGSMRTLTSMFNSNPDIACQFGNYPLLTAVPLPNDLRLSIPAGLLAANDAVRIQLRPYNIETGVVLCPFTLPTPLHIAPEGNLPEVNSRSAFAIGSGVLPVSAAVDIYDHLAPTQPASLPANARIANRGLGQPQFSENPGLGIEMSVQIAFTQRGQNETCNVTQKFEYPKDRSPPSPPDRLRVLTNASLPAGARQNRCAGPTSSVADAQIEVGFIGDTDGDGIPNANVEMERGTQFLCRDLSWRRGWAAAPTYDSPPCVTGAAIDASVQPHYPSAASEQTFPRYDQWVPCDRLRQCGVSPDTPVQYVDHNGNPRANPNIDAAGHVIRLSYSNLPMGCVMNFEAVAVDTAGNTSVAGNIATTPGILSNTRRFLEEGADLGMNEIQQPTCGTYCNGPDALAYYPAGYYTCNPMGCADPGGPYY